jgi:3-hydroxyacyl-[acyl-carrier-protein] dehydratase
MPLTDSEIQKLQQALKRCSPETVEAAIAFRTEPDPKHLPVIVYGVLERFMPPESAGKLKGADGSTRLIEDLGIDSLTMLEVVLTIEEVLNIRIENEELREIRTLGEVKAFIAKRIEDGPADADDAIGKSRNGKLTKEDLLLLLPQQPPFLFLDEATVTDNGVKAFYQVKGDEHFLEGHFRNNPVFPASIVFEAIGQAACAWVLQHAVEPAAGAEKNNEVVFASMGAAHFYKRAVPGDVLEFDVSLKRVRDPIAIFSGTVKVQGERLAAVEELMLAYGEGAAAHLNGNGPASAQTPVPQAQAA